MSKVTGFKLAFLLSLVFFLTSFATLKDYGISWDEPTHFKRGQAYLWYFLTGDNDYRKLSQQRRSIYQDDKYNSRFYKLVDGGHPPLSDILSSATNMIFYQKLGLLGDIESYHFFEIVVASLGVGVVFAFVYESFGLMSAFFSTLFFASFPLFWAESHFNIKDPIETSMIILTLYFLWKGFKDKSTFLIFFSSIFAGFALGTKFNVIFLPFIVLPWLLFIFKIHEKEFMVFIKTKKFIFSSILYPLVVFGIFYLSYPFLWQNPIANIGKVLTFYQENALDPAFANAALLDWPFYAIRWIFLTTPPLVLLGFALCLFFAKKLASKHCGFLFLIFLWFGVTILRASIPGVNIYGGVRQIMEYIPPLSILAGVGFAQVLASKNNITILGSFLIGIILSVAPLVYLHPNENVYFNFLAGGLKGAIDSGIPAAGNSFGNAYYQGVSWLNVNVEKGTKLTLLQGTAVNIPKTKLRSDIYFSGDYFSGSNRQGEYLMELTFNWEHRQNFYAWEYVDKFLEPVYEVKADGVTILKIWKNDLDHTKPEFRFSERLLEVPPLLQEESNLLTVDLNNEYLLSRAVLDLDFSGMDCSSKGTIFVDTSTNGINWNREKDWIPFSQVNNIKNLEGNKINYYFAGRKARFIRFLFDKANSCRFKDPSIKVMYFQ